MMRKSNADVLIRGGQTTQHWFRMGLQVVKGTLMFAVGIFIVVWLGLSFSYFKFENIPLIFVHYQATFFVETRGTPDVLLNYNHPQNGLIVDTAQAIFTNPEIAGLSKDYEEKAVAFAWMALVPTVIGAIVAFCVFYFSGRELEGDSHVRGTKLVSYKELKRWSKLKWAQYEKKFGKERKKGPRYTIAGIEFPPNTVEAQTVICGTVGVGKSNAILELLSTVREMDGKAIIYDRMGTYVSQFYDPQKDIIINPFDQRSHSWSPFNEAKSPEFFTQLSEVFIPDNKGSMDPFWTQAARIVFDYAAQTLFEKKEMSNQALRDAILNIPANKLAELIEKTPGRHFFNSETAKTAGSIRANLITELRFLEHLRDDGKPFSAREWVHDENRKGFVFLTADAEHAAANRNIISSILEVAANALMTMPQSDDPRIWFMMDEVPTLNRLPFLPKSLAEIRQFGGAFVVGYQVFSQLESIYGDKDAKTIAGNLNNRIIFNTPDADTAEIFSKSLGSEDVEERRESITVGAHQSRDGVGFMGQRQERRIVTASQIQSLAQFEGYISFAYDSPTAFVEFKAFPKSVSAPAFEPYLGNNQAKGVMQLLGQREDETAPDPQSSAQKKLMNDEETLREFDIYKIRIKKKYPDLLDDDENDIWLLQHFLHEKTLGTETDEIGLPKPSGQMMAGIGQKSRKTPIPNHHIVLPNQEFRTEQSDLSVTESCPEPAPKPKSDHRKTRITLYEGFSQFIEVEDNKL